MGGWNRFPRLKDMVTVMDATQEIMAQMLLDVGVVIMGDAMIQDSGVEISLLLSLLLGQLVVLSLVLRALLLL